MAAGFQLMFWFIALLIVNGLSAINPRDNEARALALVLAGLWAASNALVTIYGVPAGTRLYPILDLVGGLYAYLAWRKQPALWTFAVLWTFVLLQLTHAAFWATQWLGFGHAPVAQYLVAINSVFAVQLICVGWPGGANVAEHVRLRLRHRPRVRGPS